MDWKQLHAAITALGLKQTEIAKRSGVPQATLSEALRADASTFEPTLSTYLKLLTLARKAKPRKPKATA
jgi:transcriptional regulator with XRE-family HTH domain